MLQISVQDFLWALGSFSATHGKPFDAQLTLSQNPPPYDAAALVNAARKLGFEARLQSVKIDRLFDLPLPAIVFLAKDPGVISLGLLIAMDHKAASWIPAGETQSRPLSVDALKKSFTGEVLLVRPAPEPVVDAENTSPSRFGFAWFVPELLRHRAVWRDILLCSLILQLLALGLPLFTQAIIDKVVVHRTESTLIAVAVGMGIFTIGTAVLSWVRQYLVLHTGNRVDAVLAADVFQHLFRLPPRYFQHRPTGVVAARLHGVETIREFISSAAVTLVLDVPFLLLAVAIMFYYSGVLTCIALAFLLVIGLISAAVAPIFQVRLNEQFLLGARNQAFLTEYIGGMETVKSLQLEPQLRSRYARYLSTYLQSGFRTKQIGNSYNVAATTLEQLLTLTILLVGAWIVMHPAPQSGSGQAEAVFTIGMLVAFQMFTGRLSQPVMRLVGLWQQFQQASLAVARLGDLMNAPAEPYNEVPMRQATGRGVITVNQLAFRYAEDLPFLYENLSLQIEPGRTVAIMGPSGSGKSTFAKLLLGFYPPSGGQIKIDGVDIRHLSANHLRSTFGVVPQETVLFSGTIYENLALADPHASFEQIIEACRMAEIHQTVEALPQGYQTPIGERGAGLSGGQKQRLAIARAILKRPRVLIFDEATSALDAETAEQFAKTINALRGKVTMIFITHALPRQLLVDEVIHINRNGARSMTPQGTAPFSKSPHAE